MPDAKDMDLPSVKLTGIVTVFCGPQFAMLLASLDLLLYKRVHGMTKEDEQTANSETGISAGSLWQYPSI